MPWHSRLQYWKSANGPCRSFIRENKIAKLRYPIRRCQRRPGPVRLFRKHSQRIPKACRQWRIAWYTAHASQHQRTVHDHSYHHNKRMLVTILIKRKNVYWTYQEGVKNIIPLVISMPDAIIPSVVNRFGMGWNVSLLLCNSWILTEAGVPAV